MIRSYSELITIPTFHERLAYLQLLNTIGTETFGSNRYLNQKLYASPGWRHFRNQVITRDLGCDLGISGNEIVGKIMIHHINPITYEDLINYNPAVFDLDNVICASFETHNTIHFGYEYKEPEVIVRKPNDTNPWR